MLLFAFTLGVSVGLPCAGANPSVVSNPGNDRILVLRPDSPHYQEAFTRFKEDLEFDLEIIDQYIYELNDDIGTNLTYDF